MEPRLVADMDAPLVDATIYWSLVEKLVFLIHTRPDLAYLVNLVNRFMQAPQVPYLEGAKSILRHLIANVSTRLLYKRGVIAYYRVFPIRIGQDA